MQVQTAISSIFSMRLTLSSIGAVVGRQSHLPFGEDFAESGTQQKQHFTSYERDSETATDYAVNRQYNQSVGRFMRTDPASKSCDFKRPQSLNRYAYVMNDPINAVDRLGLEPDAPPTFKPVEPVQVYAGPPSIPTDGDSQAMLSAVIGGVRRIPWITEAKWEVPRTSMDDPTDLTPCEKALAVRDGGTDALLLTFILPNVFIARRIADAWEQSRGGPQDDNYVNAVKHCLWSCEMAKRNGTTSAWEWGEAHECDGNGKPKTDASSHMDRHNNATGRYYAGTSYVKHRGCLDTCRLDFESKLKTKP